MIEHDYAKRFASIMLRMQKVIKAMEMADYTRIDEDLLGAAIKDYFEDIDRLKEYEGMERVNTAKIYAYETYWLLKRKPIYVISDRPKEEKWLYINEMVCAMVLITKMYEEADKKLSNDKDLWEFYDLLYYNMKYRDYTQKTLELMISAFYLGAKS